MAEQRTLKRRIKAFFDWWTAGKVGLLLLALALIGGVSGYRNQHPEGFSLSQLASDFYANVSSELASIAITVLIIDTLERRRDEAERLEREQAKEQERLERQRDDLVAQLNSRLNDDACRAAEKLRALGWMEDGSLVGVQLRNANLEGADLRWANLQRAQFYRANLRGANLFGANLRYAVLTGADLREAQMGKIELEGAYLEGAKLEGARKLSMKRLAHTARLKGATMPNGERYNGCFNLKRDLMQAKKAGADLSDEASMSEWYGVSLEAYRRGQEYAARLPSESTGQWKDKKDS